MRLRFGPIIFCAVVGLWRAAWLSNQLSGGTGTEMAYLLLADLPVLGSLGILAWLEAQVQRRFRRAVVMTLTVLLVAVYVTDVLAVMALNSRLQINDVVRFAVDWWLIPSYVNISFVWFLVVLGFCFLLSSSFSARTANTLLLVSIAFLAFGLIRASRQVPSHLEKYTGSIFLLSKEIWGLRRPPVSTYRAGDFTTYAEHYERAFEVPFGRSRRNIVLVIVESLSAADSYRTSRLRNVLPRFDELSHEGVLFRNFFANYEASEGGIVALLSGVPPLHFPTASTDTFGEYAIQHSVTRTLAQAGYRCEFLTSVPIDFISMDHYARSPSVGFSHAAGQKEIARYRGAPRYGFESPTDHLLYEEVLARLDQSARAREPAFLAAITASSHPPYVDPLGRANTEANVWSYVQEEFWWLYGALQKRGFFENGVLIITGDHRKMVPVAEHERERYGEGAKARIPLLIIGTGIPRGTIDDRLFQQSDLLRMLDRVADPSTPLSPFVVWPERYMFVFGVASNASNVQVFDDGDKGRHAYRLNLQGAEIDWIDRPADAFVVERSIHQQRAMQQAERQARVGEFVLDFGRDLTPIEGAQGVLAGFSTDVELSRDPDDPAGGLKQSAIDSLSVESIRRRFGSSDAPFTLTARGFLRVPRDGPYWFSMFADRAGCLAIDKAVILGCRGGLNEGLALLTAGVHRFDLRYIRQGSKGTLDLKWLPPGEKQFVPLSGGALIQAAR